MSESSYGVSSTSTTKIERMQHLQHQRRVNPSATSARSILRSGSQAEDARGRREEHPGPSSFRLSRISFLLFKITSYIYSVE
jgi:hypothetical protein